MTSYADFLASKKPVTPDHGWQIDADSISDALYPFQRYCVEWAIRKGRAALFEDCGLGKTPQQLEWAKQVAARTDKPVLIFAPLAVAEQTKREGEKFDIPVTVCRTGADVRAGVNITNYEMMQHFTPDGLGGVVLDESSILKNYAGKMRREITEFVRKVYFRLACTATPAPNDITEIINHAEFLDVSTGKEVLALYFRQDGNTTHAWRLKRHAERDFWKWLSTWATAIRKPSDIGFDDGAFVLPPLNIKQVTTDGHTLDTMLFPIEAQTLQERNEARRKSISERVEATAALVNDSTEPWVVWCNLNDESSALASAIPGAVEIRGSQSNEYKRDSLLSFASGDARVIVTKPSIAGFGMNWQHCARMAFVGLSDSWESYYQAIRRCWRFGQTRPVTAYVICAETEGRVVANIERKEREASRMMAEIVKAMNQYREELAECI